MFAYSFNYTAPAEDKKPGKVGIIDFNKERCGSVNSKGTSILDGIFWSVQAWDSVVKETIVNCWKNAGLETVAKTSVGLCLENGEYELKYALKYTYMYVCV